MKSSIVSALKFIAKSYLYFAAIVGSLFLILIVVIVALVSSSAGTPQETRATEKIITTGSGDKVAVISISGEIFQGDDTSPFASSGLLTSTRIINLLDQAQEDESIKAVVLRINSPGGAVVASDEIYQKVLFLRGKKPVVASFGDTAASGAYYIAAGANKIIANQATITGSIGVIAELPKLSGLYDKIGVEMRTIKSGKYKDLGSPNRDLTSEETQIFQTLIDQAYDQFVTAIATGRNMDIDKVRSLADGRIYSGKDAKNNGLIDQLGNLTTATNTAQEIAGISGATIIELSPGSFLENLLSAKTAFPSMWVLLGNTNLENPSPSLKYKLSF